MIETKPRTRRLQGFPDIPAHIPQTIRIDAAVWEALRRRAAPFETPNRVLRRLLELEK